MCGAICSSQRSRPSMAAILCQFGPIDGRPVLGYVATLFAVAAAAMVAPAFVTGVMSLLRGMLKRIGGAEGLIAGRSLVASLARTSIVVTALATAISMMVSVGVMVGSFRETVQVWLDNQLRADIYMRAAGTGRRRASIRRSPRRAGDCRGRLRAWPRSTRCGRSSSATRGRGRRSAATNIDIVRRARSLRFLSGCDDSPSLPADRAMVTEPFADKHHVRTGDVLQIPLGARIVALTVAGIYYDYSSDRGSVLVDRATLLKYLPDQPVTNIAVYVQPGADATKVRRDLEARLRDYPADDRAERSSAARRGGSFRPHVRRHLRARSGGHRGRDAGRGELAASIGIGPAPRNRPDPLSGGRDRAGPPHDPDGSRAARACWRDCWVWRSGWRFRWS